ncbi:hypothetical protein INR49_032715 [Caranx melampygus]|nr:hypothetical protein INR49_032715 [Caranx melampygus]
MMSLSDPEHLDLLHRRLLLAEEEAQGIIRSMGAMGVTSEDILGPAEIMAATQRDSLVSRVSRMESLLQTFKLTLFRLETERELDPSHSAHVKQELAALQQEAEEEQQACRREVMRLRQQLQQAHRERDEARSEVQGLQETVEAATVAKMDQMDVAAAAQELKSVKAEMSQKMKEMKEQMRQEAARSAKAENSRRKLLRRLEEMEGALEVEKRQTLLLQSRGRLLSAEVKTGRQQLEEERDRGRRLEELCQRLREKTAVKESHMFELKTELEAERSRVAEQLLRATARNAHTELQVALTHNVHLQEEL